MDRLSPFAETVASSFRSTADLRWTSRSAHHVTASFEIKSLEAAVHFQQMSEDPTWAVSFETIGADLADQINVALAFRVFNGVFQAIREFLGSRQPELLVLPAQDEDSAHIHGTYLNRDRDLLDELGYELNGPHRTGKASEWMVRRVIRHKVQGR